MDNGISRRSFLKGGIAAGALGTLATIGLSGCTTTEQGEADANNQGSPSYYEVYNTDVLVIGGGNAGVYSAQPALDAGKSVILVDKGVFRHSGASGMCWDALLFWPLDGSFKASSSQVNEVIMKKAYDRLGGTAYDPRVNLINHGQTFPHRIETGEILRWFEPMPKSAQSGFYRREMDSLYEHGATIMDQTMITGLFVNEGRCLGAIGVHFPTGTFRVIRAKATVGAAAGSTTFHGWLSVGYRGINTSEATGDLDAAALRGGIHIGEAEYGQYDINCIEVPDIGCTYGASVAADAAEPERLYDLNKNQLFKPDEEIVGNAGLCQRVGRVVFEDGRGTPNGGVLLHWGTEFVGRYAIARRLPLIKEWGIDPTTDYVECVPEMFEHGGAPIVDENMMTEWTGYFCARGAGIQGEQGGPITYNNLLFGPYTGLCVLDYLDSSDSVNETEVDWKPVAQEIERLNDLRTRTASDGLRPYEILRKIQAAGYLGFDVYRSTEMMEEAITELERIRTEDMPKQVLADSTTNWNTEWKSAIENQNLLDMAEVSIKASLMREETRGCWYRPEFPQKDDENWNCMIAIQMVDGEAVFEKRDVPKLDA